MIISQCVSIFIYKKTTTTFYNICFFIFITVTINNLRLIFFLIFII